MISLSFLFFFFFCSSEKKVNSSGNSGSLTRQLAVCRTCPGMIVFSSVICQHKRTHTRTNTQHHVISFGFGSSWQMHETLLCPTAAHWLIWSCLPPPLAFWDATHCQTLHFDLGLGFERFVPLGHCVDVCLCDGPGSDNQIRSAVYADGEEEKGGGGVFVPFSFEQTRLGSWLCSFA